MRFLLALLFAFVSVSGQTLPGRYILELEGEPLATGTKAGPPRSALAIREHAARITGQHDSVRSILGSRSMRVRGEADTVANAIMVENADPVQLANLPGVLRIHEVRLLKPNLDHVAPLLKFPAAWEKVGGINVAGAGMKIGIIDTGIDPFHLGFQDPALATPDGFPRVSSEANRRFTNNKIIVARSYGGSTALDGEGHGTGVAMAAAGVLHLGARGNMAGAAPKAWLGNYSVAEPNGSGLASDNILLALDDAVKDGMDVINMSFGSPGTQSSLDDFFTQAISRAAASGVIVAGAAGNDGPEFATVSDVGSSEAIISVGATQNDRLPTTPSVSFAPSIRFSASLASNSDEAAGVEGEMVDVFNLDRTGLGCAAFPEGSLAGKIALIQRGECFFTEKFANARVAGAIAVVIFNNQTNPARIGMEVGTEVLKGLMVSRADGQSLQDQIAIAPDTKFVLFFKTSLVDDSDVISPYSSGGPTTDLLIKPDLLAIGEMITAGNNTPEGDPEASLYLFEVGTSLSSPLVAGAAAVLKAARPGLTAAQYRSLIINSASPFPAAGSVNVQHAGAGILNLLNAVTARMVVQPTAITLGELRGQTTLSRDFTISNTGPSGEILTLALSTGDTLKPDLSASTISLGPGESQAVTLAWSNASPPPGPYQGYVVITAADGNVTRVPYWLGVRGTTPKEIAQLGVPESAAPGAATGFLIRVLDASGLSLLEPAPEVTASSGGGSVTTVRLSGSRAPGVYEVRVRLGVAAGVNVFKVSVGSISTEVRIRGVR
ncbi:MAG TPA: S8 family serine peptidase [Bryobacteraceae bacterium]|nr:S8 family serine peptidase [Bryobacteraceae bacterium]